MEELFSDNRLGELEDKIDVLLQGYRDMREQKGSSVARVELLENENKTLKDQIARLEEDRQVMLQKVKGILDKIQRIDV
jgi:hypothetical protein